MKLLLRTVIAMTSMLLPASALGAGALSSNWAGYVARAPSGKPMRSVSASWVEPTVSCAAGRAAYSAVWVGLGGYRRNSSALEQIGTDADCTKGGRAVYSSWVELLPAAPVNLSLKVHPGDTITAAVTVIGPDATLGLHNLTSGARTARTVRLTAIDVSSAEWIVEAPSECSVSGSCQTLPLADFGQVAFTRAGATLGAVSSTIPTGPWSTTSLQLQDTQTLQAERAGGPGGEGLILATPSASSAADGSFTVAFSERRHEGRTPEAPTLPGFAGGPPG